MHRKVDVRLVLPWAEYKRCKRCYKTLAFAYSVDAMRRLWTCPDCNWKGGWRDWKPSPISEYEPDGWLLDLYGKHAAKALSDAPSRGSAMKPGTPATITISDLDVLAEHIVFFGRNSSTG
jgi:hypothetical protein